MEETGRSTEDLRQDIAREEENISRTARQIGERIKEKLDWSEYVKESPYWSLGIAVGVGFLAARMLQKRKTPMERIIGSLAEEVRESLHVKASGPGLVQMSLVGIGTKLAAEWIGNKANFPSSSSGSVMPPVHTEHTTIN